MLLVLRGFRGLVRGVRCDITDSTTEGASPGSATTPRCLASSAATRACRASSAAHASAISVSLVSHASLSCSSLSNRPQGSALPCRRQGVARHHACLAACYLETPG